MTATLPTASADPRPAHRDGNVLRWLAAYTASMVGDTVYFLALSWSVARTGDATQTGLVLAVGSVPRVLLMLGGGVIADRLGLRAVVMVSDLVRCLAVCGMAVTLALTTPAVWLLATVAFLFGTVDAVFMPAVGALPPRITAPDQLARVQGMRVLATRLATIGGAPLSGMAMAVGGPGAAFGVAGTLFAGSLVLLLAVRTAPLPAERAVAKQPAEPDPVTAGADGASRAEDDAPGQAGGLRQGLRYIRGHPLLTGLLVLVAVGELGFTGPANVGITLLARERGWGSTGLGWVLAAFGVGAGLASLLVTVRGAIPRAGLVQSGCLLVGSVAVGALAFVPTLYLAVVTGGVVGLTVGMAGVLSNSLVQTSTDPGYLGRVTSVTLLFAVGVAPLSYPVFGAAVGAWGLKPVFVASAVFGVAGGVFGLLLPALRVAELRRPRSPEAVAAAGA